MNNQLRIITILYYNKKTARCSTNCEIIFQREREREIQESLTCTTLQMFKFKLAGTLFFESYFGYCPSWIACLLSFLIYTLLSHRFL